MNTKYWIWLAPLLLGGCVTSGPAADALKTLERRELTPNEKASLSVSLAQTLKDPGSAQFKWMPLIIYEREGVYDYCGLINGRNSYGAYSGFQKFYAQLYKSAKGEFNSGQIRMIATDDVSTIAANGLCDGHGYTDLSAAK